MTKGRDCKNLNKCRYSLSINDVFYLVSSKSSKQYCRWCIRHVYFRWCIRYVCFILDGVLDMYVLAGVLDMYVLDGVLDMYVSLRWMMDVV